VRVSKYSRVSTSDQNADMRTREIDGKSAKPIHTDQSVGRDREDSEFNAPDISHGEQSDILV
jgi:DNA invertase Pin-like site-specific DNA recombinase